MRIADAMARNAVADFRREVGDKFPLQMLLLVEPGKGALLARQFDGSLIGRFAQTPHDLARDARRCRRAVRNTEHDERIAQTGESETDAASGTRHPLLFLQREA